MMTDSEKLRFLAEWFDKNHTSPYKEVQHDLRRIADKLENMVTLDGRTDTFLKELRHDRDKQPVHMWQYIVAVGNVRVYFKAEPEIGSGFLFYAVENTGSVCVSENENNNWHPDYTFVKCVFQGIACFDGVRHLYMGDAFTDNYGYHYYSNLETNIETLKAIRELEIKYCRDPMW